MLRAKKLGEFKFRVAEYEIQEYPHLRKQFWGRHFWARGYLAVSSGTITDEMVKEYIDDQEGEQIADDSRFPIDNP